MKKITSFDVAKLAGVSQPTVSRALRNLPGTSPETRQRVIEAASSLSYVRSESGRTLSTRRTQRIAVVSEALTNPYYPELVEPMRQRLHENGYRTAIVASAGDDGVDLEALTDGSYDGAILTTTGRWSRLPRDLTEHGVPHVLANRVLDHAEAHSCAVDNESGAQMVCELLAEFGHSVVASIQGPADTSTARERDDAVRRALRETGIAVKRSLTRRATFTHDAGMEAAMSLLVSEPRPTAIICGNDVMAMGALSAARVLGIRVPEDVSIVGFDDISMSAWPHVGLTTVRCDLEALAAGAVDLLLREIRDPGQAPIVTRYPVSLVRRRTHGPANKSAS
ncbi:LacI family transcriptional regulator [Aeromicrobium sp. A1-2]|uniref:LacI family DNA-binding transcriptional regulator n=1 Tax=Aeromicrobium sp. A1-2 TaxID=2107713 RepID=UPI000E54B077|nr:LacI family DNA-binding transcriptional regulator [Aeromicrobium sp. A1-2]AXT84250.1 LacI family transcriptional regulator [Aeromicrobium sp. A1-2]